jgi:hypothetical protein
MYDAIESDVMYASISRKSVRVLPGAALSVCIGGGVMYAVIEFYGMHILHNIWYVL